MAEIGAILLGTVPAGTGLTMASVGQVAGVLGTLGTIGGVIQQGRMADAQSKSQANAAAYNARIADQNKELISRQTAEQVQQADRERRMRLGANIAAAGASGVGMDSSGDILQSNAAQEALNILTIRSEGALREREQDIDASMQRATAFNVSQQGKASKSAAIISGISKGINNVAGGF